MIASASAPVSASVLNVRRLLWPCPRRGSFAPCVVRSTSGHQVIRRDQGLCAATQLSDGCVRSKHSRVARSSKCHQRAAKSRHAGASWNLEVWSEHSRPMYPHSSTCTNREGAKYTGSATRIHSACSPDGAGCSTSTLAEVEHVHVHSILHCPLKMMLPNAAAKMSSPRYQAAPSPE